jgi:glutamine synthetase
MSRSSRPAGMMDLDELSREIENGAIDTVVTAFPDLYGRLVGKRVTGGYFLDEVAGHGTHACDYLLACDMEMDPTPGYSFASWATGYGDVHCTPDMGTLRRAAWMPRTAIVLCDIERGEPGEPVSVAPRGVLKRQLARLAERGFTAKMGSELEFFLFRGNYRAARDAGHRGLEATGGYVEDYHVLSSTFVEDVIREIRNGADKSGIPVEFSKGEWGPGQHEINLRYAPALEMADRHVVYKLAAKEIADARGHALTFMAKWDHSLAGSSLHLHASLWNDADEPAFPGGDPLPGTRLRTSATFRHFLGGLLAHARELSWFFAPTVNSYKRYRAGTFAPTGIAWSLDNRTAGFRVVGHGPALRVECRIPGADANPYLAYSALLAAGLDGVERRLEPDPAFVGDVYAAADLPRVPSSLPEAILELERSAFARKAFGDEVIEHLLHFARAEQLYFEAVVTDWEKHRYFERV